MRHAKPSFESLTLIAPGALYLSLLQAFAEGLLPSMGISLGLLAACLLRLSLTAEMLMVLIFPAFLVEAILQGASPVAALILASVITAASAVATAAPFLPSRIGAAAMLCCAAMIVQVPSSGPLGAFWGSLCHFAFCVVCLAGISLVTARWRSPLKRRLGELPV